MLPKEFWAASGGFLLNSPKNEILSKVLDALRTKVNDFNYKNWFQNLDWTYEEPFRVLIKVPSKFVRDWLSEHYLEVIKFEFFRLTEREHEVVFKVERHINKTLELFPDAIQASVPNVSVVPVAGDNHPIQNVNHFIRHQQGQSAGSQASSQAGSAVTPSFNPRYSFDHFVVGNSNQLVHAACKAVALQPAKSYNPLFIYGGVGLGKTHLLNAIGLEVARQYPSWRVIYTTGERFTNEVISAIRYGKTYELRKKYRDNCDMLLIDDIQFIAGKERTMEEFFHTFNALYELRKQIILTSDQLPKDIVNLEERLKSRFGWGLMADIQIPDYETRMAILHEKAEEDAVEVPDAVCTFIAAQAVSNVRDLEGMLVRVSAFASLTKLPITLDLAKDVLKDMVPNLHHSLSVEGIQNKVAEYYELKITDLKSKRRHKNLAVPRHIAMYLCKTHLVASFPEIGHKFGGKDHTTVMHAVQKIKKCLTEDGPIKSDIAALEKQLGCTHV